MFLMSEKIKVLILGNSQSNFLNQLYSQIKKRDNSFDFFVNNYWDLSKGEVNFLTLPYNSFFDFKNQPISKWKHLKSFVQFSCTRFFWKIIFFEISQNSNLRKIKDIILDFSKAKYRAKEYIDPLQMDLIHFHFCVPQNLQEIFFINPKTKIICSFWGSDLLRFTGVSNVFYVGRALKRANSITIQTLELAEILYSKYGRNFKMKTEILRFNLGIEILEEIDLNRGNEKLINQFKERYKIPLDKTQISLGHNSFSENNHLLMIDEIRKLPKKISDNLVFVLHLGYGGEINYIKKLIELALHEQNIELIVINQFFDAKEIALLRLSTELFIHMPTTDALSAAMTEVLYAGNIVITGAWLPYGILKRNGIFFYEIEEFYELKPMLISILKNSSALKKYHNRELIRNFLLPGVTTPKWIQLFNKTSI